MGLYHYNYEQDKDRLIHVQKELILYDGSVRYYNA